MNDIDGNQSGDPDKIADAFLKLVNSETPAVNLFLGSDSFKRAEAKIEQLKVQMENWQDVSYVTDFQ